MNFYINIALPVPIKKTQSFIYLPKKNTVINDYNIGARVEVPFGKRKLIGIVTNILNIKEFSGLHLGFALKEVITVIDQENIFGQYLYDLLNFAAKYYHYPLGEVFFSGLPQNIKQGDSLDKFTNKIIYLNTDSKLIKTTKKLSVKQKQLIDLLDQHQKGLSLNNLQCLGYNQKTIDSLLNLDWLYAKSTNIENFDSTKNNCKNKILKQDLLKLNQEQEVAVQKIINFSNNFSRFASFLLYGITGSGKTEVYLNLIYQNILNNKQVLVLVPEISLTPQTVSRFKNRFKIDISVIHSKVGVSAKTRDWLAAKNGSAKIILGTRSAIFTPIKNLSLIIIDEEHDQSFKQQDGFRYNGRDLAISRAKLLNIPIVLGSATPSVESVANVTNKKYFLLELKQRAGNAILPKIKLLNIKQNYKYLKSGLSQELLKLIKQTLNNKNQVLLFLNRRGYAPVLKCKDCNWGALCNRCNVYYTVHKQDNLLVCHYCDSSKKLYNSCQDCGSIDLITYGVGTEQLEQFLNLEFNNCCIRIDRDTIKTKKDLETSLDLINLNKPQILLGTQMLAKGHHFPKVTLVAVIDADSSLFSSDFRAPERLVQLLIQVAGRAGREGSSSEVIIQTTQPEHQLFQDILHKDYWDIAVDLYNLRKATNLPPCSSWGLIRAESLKINNTISFLIEVKQLYLDLINNKNIDNINIAGPVLAPRIKQAGNFRGQLLISSNNRKNLQNIIHLLLEKIKTSDIKASSIKWSIDVDPVDIL